LAEWVLSGQGSKIAGIVAYNACDTLRNLPEILHTGLQDQNQELPIFTFHIPQVGTDTPQWGQYLREEIFRLITRLEEHFGVAFSLEQFWESVAIYKKQRDLVRELEESVRNLKLSFGEFARLLMENQFAPVETQVENFDLALQDVASSVPLRAEPFQFSRIIISGILPPPSTLADAIEGAGFWVVGNDIAYLERTYGTQSPETPTQGAGEFYEDFYRNHVPCSTLLYSTDRRAAYLCELAEQYRASSVIFLAEKYCECENFEIPFLRKILAGHNIECLVLEVGVGDEENLATLQNRVEAFWEVLANKTSGELSQ
jgi:benzoyl-CoA reductase/2-hydroxyglutaryl-CoA dehydratase subunit BcrC/BadD/HgdB